MNWKTHMAVGAAAALVYTVNVELSMIAPPPSVLSTVCAAVLASLLPDLDHPGALLSRRFPPLRIIFMWFSHRGFTHSLFAAALLAAGVHLAAPSLAAGAVIGYISHIVSDMLTERGVKLLWPLPLPVGIPLIGSSGLLENILQWMAFGVIAIILFQYSEEIKTIVFSAWKDYGR